MVPIRPPSHSSGDRDRVFGVARRKVAERDLGLAVRTRTFRVPVRLVRLPLIPVDRDGVRRRDFAVHARVEGVVANLHRACGGAASAERVLVVGKVGRPSGSTDLQGLRVVPVAWGIVADDHLLVVPLFLALALVLGSAGPDSVTVVLLVGRQRVHRNSDGVRVGWVARWDVANGDLVVLCARPRLVSVRLVSGPL